MLISGMRPPPHVRLRRVGTMCLVLALAMLVLGLTFLSAQLRGMTFIFYWCGCIVFLGLTVVAALLDLMVTRREVRDAQRELLEESFKGLNVGLKLTGSDEDRQPNVPHKHVRKVTN